MVGSVAMVFDGEGRGSLWLRDDATKRMTSWRYRGRSGEAGASGAKQNDILKRLPEGMRGRRAGARAGSDGRNKRTSAGGERRGWPKAPAQRLWIGDEVGRRGDAAKRRAQEGDAVLRTASSARDSCGSGKEGIASVGRWRASVEPDARAWREGVAGSGIAERERRALAPRREATTTKGRSAKAPRARRKRGADPSPKRRTGPVRRWNRRLMPRRCTRECRAGGPCRPGCR